MARTARPGTSIDDLAASFALHLEAEAKSPKTIKIYLSATSLLAAFLTDERLPTDSKRLRRAHVAAFMASLNTRGWKPASCNQVHRSLVQFFTFCLEDGEITHSPMQGLAAPKIPDDPQPTVDPESVKAILKAIKGDSFTAKRDRAIIQLFYDAGVRRGELAALKLGDLDLRGHIATVTGKGNKVRRVPFGAKTATALDRYLRDRARWTAHGDRRQWATSDRLWLGSKGPVSDWGIGQIVRRRAIAAKVPHISAHAFRRGFATTLIRNGMDAGHLMKLAGWNQRAMVDRYIRATSTELALADYKGRSPMDNLDG